MKKVWLSAFGLATFLVACPSPDVNPTPKPPSDTVQEAPITPNGTLGSFNDLLNGGKALQEIPQATNNSLQAKLKSVSDALVPKVNYILPTSAGLSPMQLLSALQSGSVTKLLPQATVNQTLPRGNYDCRSATAANPNCVKTNSDDYKIVFTNSSNTEVVLLADWDASTAGTASPTQTVTTTNSGNTYNNELPTKSVFGLQVGTTKIVEASISAAWAKAAVKSFPSAVSTVEQIGLVNGSLKGIARTLAGANIVIIRGITYAAGVNKVSTTGDFSIVDSDTFRARWNIEVGMTPDNPNTVLAPLIGVMNYKPTGDSKVAASLEINADQYAFKFDTSNYIESPMAISIANGLIFQKGKTATFTGILNDANKNCIPGDELNVTTNGATQSLQTILVNSFSVKACPIK
jgi:hypothetical protein